MIGMENPTSPICPLCGAVYPDGQTCEDVFNTLLALEFTDPAAGAVHHLTVIGYMLQHDGYSVEARAWAEEALRAILEDGLTPGELRRRSRRRLDGGERRWGVRNPEEPRRRLDWPVTLADVWGDPAGHPDRVRRWARSVLDTIQAPTPPGPGG